MASRGGSCGHRRRPQQPPPGRTRHHAADSNSRPKWPSSITGDPGTPPRYAVPDFVALSPEAAEVAKTIGEVLWDDLNFEREFYMIPRDTYATDSGGQASRRRAVRCVA